MNRFSPKIEIINHFDNLINRVDIDIDECLEKYNQKQTIGELECFNKAKRDVKNQFTFIEFKGDSFSNKIPSSNKRCKKLWSKSTKVVDYLKKVRERTLEQLRKAQKDNLDYLKLNSTNFVINDNLKDENKLDDLKSQLFGGTFYFQVFYKPPREQWVFNLYTIITDFYMSPTDIIILEKAINAQEYDEKPFGPDFKLIIDEKMVLIGLIQRLFFENLETEEFPSHLIRVSKHDLSKFNSIDCFQVNEIDLTCSNIDLSNINCLHVYSSILVGIKLKIENLSSLNTINSNITLVECISFKNLLALKELRIKLKSPVNSSIAEMLSNHSPNIESLTLEGSLYNFNFDRLIRLKKLNLNGLVMEDFNFDILKNLSNRLTDLSINCRNIDNEMLVKIFNVLRFSNLSNFSISSNNITKLDTTLFERFPMLKCLSISKCNKLRINGETFSSLKQLTQLNMSFNRIDSLENVYFTELSNLESLDLNCNGIEFIQDSAFSNLKKLQRLNLGKNQIEKLSPQLFFGLRNLKYLLLDYNNLRNFDLSILDNFDQIKEINLNGNSIINKETILNRFKDSKITFIF